MANMRTQQWRPVHRRPAAQARRYGFGERTEVRLVCPRCRRRSIAEAAFDGDGGRLLLLERRRPVASQFSNSHWVTHWPNQPTSPTFADLAEGGVWTLRCSAKCGGTSTVRNDRLEKLVRGALEAGLTSVRLP
jgi:hypothetical protein